MLDAPIPLPGVRTPDTPPPYDRRPGLVQIGRSVGGHRLLMVNDTNLGTSHGRDPRRPDDSDFVLI